MGSWKKRKGEECIPITYWGVPTPVTLPTPLSTHTLGSTPQERDTQLADELCNNTILCKNQMGVVVKCAQNERHSFSSLLNHAISLHSFKDRIEPPVKCADLLTLSVHAPEGYSSHLVCQYVVPSICQHRITAITWY